MFGDFEIEWDSGLEEMWMPYLVETGHILCSEGRYKDAFPYIYLSAKNDNSKHSQYLLGEMFRQGLGTRQNLEEAKKWYKLAGASGIADACLQLGIIYYEENDHSSAFDFITKAYELGDKLRAAYNLGILYLLGEGVMSDYTKAEMYTREAADGGHCEAQFNLGNIYETKYKLFDSSSQNYKEAIFWYQKAANQGYPNAQEALYKFRKEVSFNEQLISFFTIEWWSNLDDKWKKILKNNIKTEEGNINFFSEIINLKNLNASHSELEELPNWIEKLNQLVGIDLSSNMLQKLPKYLENFPNLTWLSIDANPMKEFPIVIGELVKLEVLSMNTNLNIVRANARNLFYRLVQARTLKPAYF